MLFIIASIMIAIGSIIYLTLNGLESTSLFDGTTNCFMFKVRTFHRRSWTVSHSRDRPRQFI